MNLLKLTTEEFLKHIDSTLSHYLNSITDPILKLDEYIPENIWKKIKEAGILLPFLPLDLGGRKFNQNEILETLRIAGNYGVPFTLRLGIEGALVIQPLLEFATEELINEILPIILNDEGGGLGITEPNTSGSMIVRDMESYYEIIDENNIKVFAEKYWQGNSQSKFLLIAAKEKINERISKTINLIFVPKEFISFKKLETEGLKQVKYATNTINTTIPKKYLISLSDSKFENLRKFQSIFIRSRLQLIGMIQGVSEAIKKNINQYAKIEVEFVLYELNQINQMGEIIEVLFNFVNNNISPSESVEDRIMEANIVKTLSTDYIFKMACIAQKLLGAKGYEKFHPISSIVLNIRPFTIFEGPNDMLYADIFDSFSKSTIYEKLNGIKVNKNISLYDRIINDKRFLKNNLIFDPTILKFLKIILINEVNQIQKVFIGKIIAKFFVYTYSLNNFSIEKILTKDIKKDIIDYYD